MSGKGKFARLGEAIDQHLEDRASRGAVSVPARRRSWLRSLLPTPGNVVFTLLIIAMLAVANRAGAININAPAATSTATIPYQGRLATSSGTPFTGLQSMEFRLYALPTGGTPLWTEYWTGGNAVNVSDGLFSVLLGSLTVNPSLASVVQGNTQLWLGITIGTDTEMTPRVQLGSAAYSMQALSVPDGSISSTKLGEQSVTGSKIADGSVSAPKLVDFGITAAKLVTASVSTEKLVDASVSARKLKSTTYSQSTNDSINVQTNWVPVPPLSVLVPASDVPTSTKALVMFQARCSLSTNGAALGFSIVVDGAAVNYTDSSTPTANQTLIYSINDVIALTANTVHNISVWAGASIGSATCQDRRLNVILLGQ